MRRVRRDPLRNLRGLTEIQNLGSCQRTPDNKDSTARLLVISCLASKTPSRDALYLMWSEFPKKSDKWSPQRCLSLPLLLQSYRTILYPVFLWAISYRAFSSVYFLFLQSQKPGRDIRDHPVQTFSFDIEENEALRS